MATTIGWSIFALGSLLTAVFLAAAACSSPPLEPTPVSSGVAAGGDIGGMVVNAEGGPVEGMRVGIVGGTAGFPEIAPQTDEGGGYSIGGVSPGTYEVAVHDRDGETVASRKVEVKAGAKATLDFSVVTQVAASSQPGRSAAQVTSVATTIADRQLTDDRCLPAAPLGVFDYPELLVSFDQGQTEEPALVTSYRCLDTHVDSTGRQPSLSPSHIVSAGAPLSLRLPTERPPVGIEARLYAGAGVYGSFFKWPEELPTGEEALGSLTPEKAHAFQYLPEQPPGDYTLVVRASWDGPIDVLYAVSFKVQ